MPAVTPPSSASSDSDDSASPGFSSAVFSTTSNSSARTDVLVGSPSGFKQNKTKPLAESDGMTGRDFCRSLPQGQDLFGHGHPPPRVAELPEMILQATVNNGTDSFSVHAACLPDGRLAIADEDWHAMHLRPVEPASLPDGRVFRPILAANGAHYSIDTLAQTMSINVNAGAFEGTQIQGRQILAQAPPPPPFGGYLTYDASATFGAAGLAQYGVALKAVAFGPWGMFHSDGFVTSGTYNNPGFVRGETYYEKSDVANMTTLTIGDTTGVGGSWSRPVRFAGISYARDFTTRPDYVTFPLPSLNGSAALPSTIDVLVNNVQRLSTSVPAGPFELANVPVISGSGNIQLVVRDSLGRQTILSQNYYADAQLLEKGLTAFSFEGGFERLYYGEESFNYGRPVGAATYRWGAEKWLTLEARAEAETDRGALGLGIRTRLGLVGVVSAAAGYAVADNEHGLTYDFGFQTTGPFVNASVSWQHSDRGYRPFAAQPSEIRPRDAFSAGGGLQLGSAGSITAVYLRQSQWDGSTNEFVMASWMKTIGSRLSLGLQSNYDLQGGVWEAQLRLSLRLGRRTSASGNFITDGQGVHADLDVSSPNANQPGFGWNLMARSDGSIMQADASYNASWARLSGDIAKSGDEVEGRIGITGSVAIMGGDTFYSRPITNSFAIVRTGGVDGLSIMRWNQPVAVSNHAGMAMINDILPYENNKISVDPSALPMDVEIGGSEVNARAWPGAGVFVDMPLKRITAIMVHLRLPDGSRVPLGATIMLKTGGDTTFVGKDGEVWLTGGATHNNLVATWTGGTCGAQFDIPKATSYGADLGDVICRRELLQ